ncbi:hypothetical protein [Micromonospora sp. NPDC050200]|uniref:hypothetical protein n=1 Tax=Micromonospora sp. NPDC050200 TaxID=3155664 RepID=UPI0033E42CA3
MDMPQGGHPSSVPPIMVATAEPALHVLFNNCCEGQAQRDAARLAELLGATPAPERAGV